MKIELAVLLEIQSDAESDRHRYPAKVEESGQQIGYGMMVCGEIFAKSDAGTFRPHAETFFLGFIKTAYVYGVDFIIGADAHPVV